MRLESVTQGKRFSVWAIVQSENPYSCPAITFLGSLGEATRKKIANVLRLQADEGPLRNEQKSRLLEDGIYEFKTTDGARLLYFFASGQRTVLTNGFKKGAKVTTETGRAKRLRAEWMDQSC